jgi:adenylate cyclase
MKRALVVPLGVGAVSAGVTIGLQLAGVFVRPNTQIDIWLGQIMPDDYRSFGYLIFLLLLSFVVAWVMLQMRNAWRRTAIFALLVAEIIGAAWLFGRFEIAFAPLPALVAISVATALAIAAGFTRSARQHRTMLRLFGAHLGPAAQSRLTTSKSLDPTQPLFREASFVFCEIANEAELIEELTPADCAAVTRQFIMLASEHFLQAGGYLHAADGEGIRVLFGFPNEDQQHAAEACKAALGFRDKFRAAATHKPESLGKIDLRIGISSGAIIATLRDGAARGEILLAGEPFEIGRRLARANQVYGSQILLGPQTFNAARQDILARPIDFVSNADAHERFEIYELLGLTEHATADEIARRDQFWTGVVYFRERRWNEAMAEFDRARGDNGQADLPLQWYLRRLEPLCQQVATNPAPAAGPLTHRR